MHKTLKNFTGVKRRFQLKGRVDDVMVVDDYGHHPAEIEATLKAARLFGPKRLISGVPTSSVFQDQISFE